MSSNNYIRIEEFHPEKFRVSEKDYETETDMQRVGEFDSFRLAVYAAEEHIRNSEYGVEYGIRFSLFTEEKDDGF